MLGAPAFREMPRVDAARGIVVFGKVVGERGRIAAERFVAGSLRAGARCEHAPLARDVAPGAKRVARGHERRSLQLGATA
jgi:hypothetical protein